LVVIQLLVVGYGEQYDQQGARDQKDFLELRLNETPKRWFVEDWTGIQESINVLDEVGSW